MCILEYIYNKHRGWVHQSKRARGVGETEKKKMRDLEIGTGVCIIIDLTVHDS